LQRIGNIKAVRTKMVALVDEVVAAAVKGLLCWESVVMGKLGRAL